MKIIDKHCLRKAFTIVEVLVSIMILASVATVLFELSSKSKDNIINYTKRLNFECLASVGLDKKVFSNANLYEQIRFDYSFRDYRMRQALKKIKLKKITDTVVSKKLDKEDEKSLMLIIKKTQIIKDGKDKMTTTYFEVGLK